MSAADGIVMALNGSERGPNILIPKFRAGTSGSQEAEPVENWVERTLRNGSFLHEYIRREKATSQRRMREVAVANQNYERKPGSEHNLLGVMPMREFMRWQNEEPGLVNDKNEYRKLVRDNPEMRPFARK